MHPNIIIGSAVIPIWHAMLLTGAIVSTLAAVYSRPRDFPLTRKDIFRLGAIITLAGIFGARLLFIILNEKPNEYKVSDIYSLQGGFAYFGALAFSILAFRAYSSIRKIRFLTLLDYTLPFVMLSQLFVRIGCFLTGCCYGKPTTGFPGAVFKTVDSLRRHPTQIYEVILLLLIYVAMRRYYKTNSHRAGLTAFGTLAMYGLGRNVLEHFRTDSPAIFMNITLAQAACLALAALSIFAILFFNKSR